ncbi:MAG: SprT family zinc-dependent metalloprotease [Victivallaceae bacterium]|nr:SprT family zinc-dependent metalloprotease [Victivallaceae bacterium]
MSTQEPERTLSECYSALVPFRLVLRRSARRRTLSMRISRERRLIAVSAPESAAESEILAWVDRHHAWLEKHAIADGNSDRSVPLMGEFRPGGIFLFFGEEYRLTVTAGRRKLDSSLHGFAEGGRMLVPDVRGVASLRRAVFAIYAREARCYLGERTAEWARTGNFVYRSVAVNSAAHRWGSCNSRGEIRYSLRLMGCDADLIDYVIVHELSHTVELNHSPAFYRVVEQVLPNHKMLRDRMKKYR